jgi:single-stranded-DNA-specific exonuclease
LVFKLAHALVKRARQAGIADAQDLDLRHFLDLVALGTIADLAPLTGENRILVKTGLERLNITPRPGLQALKSVAQVSMPLQVHAVAFQLAPRLNAAGRLEDAEAALRLLLTQNPTEAESLARELDARNRQRQAIERAIADEVIKAVGAKFNPETDYVIVEGQVRWHIGVVGIVASRVLRQFGRPTIIIGGEGDQWRGSGRSLECLDLAAALRECDELLVRHGGHALAVGLTIQPDKIDALRTRLNELARRALKPEQLQPALRLDACVSLADLTVESLTELAQLEPIGQGNPAVQFAVQRVRNQRQPQRLGQEQQHVKLWITDGAAIQEAVWWAAGAAVLPSGAFDLAFEPRINEFNGRRTVQLKLLDWRPAQATPA